MVSLLFGEGVSWFPYYSEKAWLASTNFRTGYLRPMWHILKRYWPVTLTVASRSAYGLHELPLDTPQFS